MGHDRKSLETIGISVCHLNLALKIRLLQVWSDMNEGEWIFHFTTWPVWNKKKLKKKKERERLYTAHAELDWSNTLFHAPFHLKYPINKNVKMKHFLPLHPY